MAAGKYIHTYRNQKYIDFWLEFKRFSATLLDGETGTAYSRSLNAGTSVADHGCSRCAVCAWPTGGLRGYGNGLATSVRPTMNNPSKQRHNQEPSRGRACRRCLGVQLDFLEQLDCLGLITRLARIVLWKHHLDLNRNHKLFRLV